MTQKNQCCTIVGSTSKVSGVTTSRHCLEHWTLEEDIRPASTADGTLWIAASRSPGLASTDLITSHVSEDTSCNPLSIPMTKQTAAIATACATGEASARACNSATLWGSSDPCDSSRSSSATSRSELVLPTTVCGITPGNGCAHG
eukprot:CAMPEP_0172880154 /NCGR_PEP_ID=MMETSP1075-20121228/114349_1 /TAXON_ID=2916 /ORGANISM="Ceratium fusus, Strain PA161109" /LENGTH=144 /DNA_ID=CAMNT_0013732313 /DNA_START=19 /DNA_END=453 /DNA_ORIENTATION=+